ncbi:hypothetical protein CL620_04640 [archaeon]|jgi:hypothetical protein|nr:hypothetical protein [archaeon]
MAKQPPPQQQSSFDNQKLYMWVKGLEGKVNNLLREIDLIKNDFIKKTIDLKKEVKSANNDLLEMKHSQEKMMQQMDLMVQELKKTAGIEQVTVLKKYVEYWNPMNFVTQRDLQQAVDVAVSKPKTER